jgi:hypothetical protein
MWMLPFNNAGCEMGRSAPARSVADRIELELDVPRHAHELRTTVPDPTECFDGNRIGRQHVGQVHLERRRDLSAGHEQVRNVRVGELSCHRNRSNSALFKNLDPALHARDEWQDRSQTPAWRPPQNPSCFLELESVRRGQGGSGTAGLTTGCEWLSAACHGIVTFSGRCEDKMRGCIGESRESPHRLRPH